MSELSPIVSTLDPGIAKTVQWLRDNGFNTTDSGDGVSKPEDERVMDEPHVFMVTKKAELLEEADRLYHLVVEKGLGGKAVIEASYNPNDGIAALVLMGISDKELFQ